MILEAAALNYTLTSREVSLEWTEPLSVVAKAGACRDWSAMWDDVRTAVREAGASFLRTWGGDEEIRTGCHARHRRPGGAYGRHPLRSVDRSRTANVRSGHMSSVSTNAERSVPFPPERLGVFFSLYLIGLNRFGASTQLCGKLILRSRHQFIAQANELMV